MKSGRIEEKYIAIIIREVLAALNYIHKADIIHRDVKAANILVTNDGRVQLCDFGVAAQLAANHFKRNTFVGTPYWMAPEVISDGLSYNYKADIWSLGITIYEIATGNPPYADQEPMRAIFLIPRNTAPQLEGTTFSMPMKEFVGMCLNEQPEDRPAAAELHKTRWIKQSHKMQTYMLRDLILRYEGWRKNGGIRKSLAMGGDMDVDEEFGGHFGLDESSDMTPNAWDFGTLRKAGPLETVQPTWEQSADATEDLLRTIRPVTTPTQIPPSSSGSIRYDHPLMKLFGENKSVMNPASQSMLELSTNRTPLSSEPSTPMGETITIEMPALNATSLASVSSVSLPALPSQTAQVMPNLRSGEVPSRFGKRELAGKTPSRQNSSDIFSLQAPRSVTHDNRTLAPSLERIPPGQERPEDIGQAAGVAQSSSSSSPPKSASLYDSPTKSRSSSPTRIAQPYIMSPPSSPSRSGQRVLHPANTSISSMPSVVPKSGLSSIPNPSHITANITAPIHPDILPRPSISGPSRDRSLSSSSVSLLTKQHVKKPSNLVLQTPTMLNFSEDNACLPPSPSRLLLAGPPSTVITTHTPTTLSGSTAVLDNSQNEPSTGSIRMFPSKVAIQLPELRSLNLEVLTSKDQSLVVDELSRVVGDMLSQLTHVENGLSNMTFSS